jgi:hypothetical protein
MLCRDVMDTVGSGGSGRQSRNRPRPNGARCNQADYLSRFSRLHLQSNELHVLLSLILLFILKMKEEKKNLLVKESRFVYSRLFFFFLVVS